MPLFWFKLGMHKYSHADDGLDIIGYAGAGNDPPTDNTEHSHTEGGDSFVLLRRDSIGEMILACLFMRC